MKRDSQERGSTSTKAQRACLRSSGAAVVEMKLCRKVKFGKGPGNPVNSFI